MWTCPKCKRRFKNTNQSHYCGEPPQTIDDYIGEQSEIAIPFLHEINETIKAAIPDAKEKITWAMPTYWKEHNLIQFAAFSNHISLYIGPEAAAFFEDRLQGYEVNKGTVRFSYDKPLPLELIAEIAKWCEEFS